MAYTIERIEPVFIVSITGSDRNKWLHNFCSNDIKSLVPGGGCEAFVLNVKGRTLCHAVILANETSLTLIATGLPAASLVEHFDRYIIREDVQVADVSGTVALWWSVDRPIAQNQSASWSHSLLKPGIISINASITSSSDSLYLVTDHARDAFSNWALINDMIIADRPKTTNSECETFNAARIAAGWPLNSVDLTALNLPQEFGRDKQAISFSKGCYLGQETVARLDAMGHVNQQLVVLKTSANPENLAGAELLSIDNLEKTVGKITSSTRKNDTETIALAMIRVAALNSNIPFQTAKGDSVHVVTPGIA